MVSEAGLAELGLWAALRRSESFGEYRADLRAAMIAAVFANAHRDPQKKPEPFRVRDFLLYPPEEPESTASLGERLRSALVAHSGELKGEELRAWRSARRRELRAK